MLKKGATVVLKVELLKGKVQIVQDGKVLAARDVVVPFEPADAGVGVSSFPPLDRAWVKKVQALPPTKQVEAVAAELKRRNPGLDGKPGFDGRVTHLVGGGAVTELALCVDHVTDLTPVRVLTRLRALRANGSGFDQGQLADLSPLRGMRLTSLECSTTKVSDLSPLQGMPLTQLNLWATPVSEWTWTPGRPARNPESHFALWKEGSMRNVYALCLAASLFGLAFAALLPSAAPTAAARPPKAPGPPKPPKVHKTPKPSRAHRTAKHAKAHKASKLAKGVKPTRRHQQKMRKTHVRPQNATSKRHREPQKKSNAQLAQALRALKASHAVLGKADHDYGGHRKAAQRDIGQAEKSLEAALGSRGGQEKGVGPAQARPLAPRAAG